MPDKDVCSLSLLQCIRFQFLGDVCPGEVFFHQSPVQASKPIPRQLLLQQTWKIYRTGSFMRKDRNSELTSLESGFAFEQAWQRGFSLTVDRLVCVIEQTFLTVIVSRQTRNKVAARHIVKAEMDKATAGARTMERRLAELIGHLPNCAFGHFSALFRFQHPLETLFRSLHSQPRLFPEFLLPFQLLLFQLLVALKKSHNTVIMEAI